VLLEGNRHTPIHRPYVCHLHDCRLSGALVLPNVSSEHHHSVTICDELFGRHRIVIADFAESRRSPLDWSTWALPTPWVESGFLSSIVCSPIRAVVIRCAHSHVQLAMQESQRIATQWSMEFRHNDERL
jgi:hypothetical protein